MHTAAEPRRHEGERGKGQEVDLEAPTTQTGGTFCLPYLMDLKPQITPSSASTRLSPGCGASFGRALARGAHLSRGGPLLDLARFPRVFRES